MRAEATERAAWAAGLVLVFALRMGLSLSDPDLVHPVDPAELAHLKVVPALVNGELANLLAADANVHHGGFFWLGLPVGLVRALTGSDLWAVRGVAAMCAAVAWGIWVVLARRLGGLWAAMGLGTCLAVPSPWMAQWTATLWGSHAEASIWTGLWGLALVSGWRPRALGTVLGLGVAWDPLLWPTLGLAVGVSSERRRLVPWAVGAWMALRLPTLLASPTAFVETSFSEHPQHSLGGLLGAALSPSGLGASLAHHLDLPWVASAVVGDVPAGVGLSVLWVVAAVLLAKGQPGDTRVGRWLVASVLVHLLVLVLLSPTRPTLAHRYLVAWWPAVLLVPWALPGRLRGLAAAPVLASVLALPLYRPAFSTMQLQRAYPAAAFQEAGLDRVPVARAESVSRFLALRDDGATEGFAAMFSPRWGYPVWGEPFPEQVRAAGLAQRLEDARATGRTAQVDRDAGFGLVVVCDLSGACVDDGLYSLQTAGLDVADVQQGVAEARRELGSGMPKAASQ